MTPQNEASIDTWEAQMDEAFDKWKSNNLLVSESGEVYTLALKMGKKRDVMISIDTFEKCFKAAYSLQQEKIEKFGARLKEAEEALKDISKYDTCHKCEHYMGSLKQYCLYERCADIGDRPHYEPSSGDKKRAREYMAKWQELK
jgi:hypothetical protein